MSGGGEGRHGRGDAGTHVDDEVIGYTIQGGQLSKDPPPLQSIKIRHGSNAR